MRLCVNAAQSSLPCALDSVEGLTYWMEELTSTNCRKGRKQCKRFPSTALATRQLCQVQQEPPPPPGDAQQETERGR
jgi:hypothetical protein